MPVICEGSPTDGCVTLVSIDDFKAGEQVGVWAGNYAKANLGGKAIVLDVGLPALSTTVARSEGFAAGLKSVLPDAVIAQSVDGTGPEGRGRQGLRRCPHRASRTSTSSSASTMTPRWAACRPTRPPAWTRTTCSSSASAAKARPARTPSMEGGPYKVSAAMFPEYQGRLLIDAAIAAFNGTPLPAHIVAPSTPITKDNLAQFYTKDGDNYTADL